MATKEARLQEVFKRLADARSVGSRQQALDLLDSTIRAVEDTMTSIPYNPEAWLDGRMYAPRADAARSVSGRPDVTRYRSARHNTFIRENGAIEIRTIDDAVVFSKVGRDARGVSDE